MLGALWFSSFSMAVSTLAVMLFLVLRRAMEKRAGLRRELARRRLVRALIEFGQDRQGAPLGASLAATPLDIVAGAGFEVLDLIRGDERAQVLDLFARAGLPTHLRRRLRVGREADRLRAAELLAAFPGEQTVESLIAALEDDRSAAVRIAAAISLARLADGEVAALPPLSRVLTAVGPEAARSGRLLDFLRAIPAARQEEIRDQAVRASVPKPLRAAAIEALSATGDPRLLDLFERLAGDEAGELAATALRALGRIGHPRSLPTILSGMRSCDWRVRLEAADAASRLGLPAATAPLAALLDDTLWSVRYAAGKALRNMAPQGLATLRDIAESAGSRSQRTASLVLSEGAAA